MKPLYIFDLDGTLALNEHRQHFLHNPWIPIEDYKGSWSMSEIDYKPDNAPIEFVRVKKKPDWDGFFKACRYDKPNDPVISIFHEIHRGRTYCNSNLNDIWIWSGRSDAVYVETCLWIKSNLYVDFLDGKTAESDGVYLKMRPEGDHTPDDELKEKWLNEMTPEDRARLVCVFGDRRKVVDMWRRNGVTCLQVAEGDF